MIIQIQKKLLLRFFCIICAWCCNLRPVASFQSMQLFLRAQTQPPLEARLYFSQCSSGHGGQGCGETLCFCLQQHLLWAYASKDLPLEEMICINPPIEFWWWAATLEVLSDFNLLVPKIRVCYYEATVLPRAFKNSFVALNLLSCEEPHLINPTVPLAKSAMAWKEGSAREIFENPADM